jgi:hypothetical protein
MAVWRRGGRTLQTVGEARWRLNVPRSCEFSGTFLPAVPLNLQIERHQADQLVNGALRVASNNPRMFVAGFAAAAGGLAYGLLAATADRDQPASV